MDLKRFFLVSPIDSDQVTVFGEEFYHAIKVTRHKVGYKLILCDNTGYDYYGTVTEIFKDSFSVKIDEKIKNDTELETPVSLFIGNNKDLDIVVQKAVEMGVKRIVPFISQHCNLSSINIDRLRKIVVESSKQTGRAVLAEVTEAVTFDEAINMAQNGKKIVCYEHENERRIEDVCFCDKDPVSIFIGCEGGFSENEIEIFKNNGFYVCTLGRRILRVATAVVASCALINSKLES